ncbi:MAG: helix-turn-helix domain-containing protein [Candidatus Hodarchaeales archaeon]|jgi:predicted transcriptional regulator
MSDYPNNITRTVTKIKSRSKQNDYHRLNALLKQSESIKDFKICEFLLANGPATRGEIVDATSIKWTTAYDTLTRLHMKGILKREAKKLGRGRPRVYWSLEK